MMSGPMMVYAGFLISALLALAVTIYMISRRNPSDSDDSEPRD